ncbi:MAG: hypothetical protein AABY22_05815 [Nanoarchaeota archaeon]
MKTFKIYRWGNLKEPERQDENDLIASLVRMGYEVYLDDDYICFKIGVDDVIEVEKCG